MREGIAAVIFFISIKSLDVTDHEGSVFYGICILVAIASAVFFCASVVERFNQRMQNWFRITPGEPTVVDEEEWAKMGTPGPVPGVQKPTPPASEFHSPTPEPPAPEPDEPVDLYDRLPPIEHEESEPPK